MLTIIIFRIRKANKRLKMKQLKLAVGLLVASSCSITLLMCYWNRSAMPDHKAPTAFKLKVTSTEKRDVTDIPMRHVPLNEIYHDQSPNDSLDIYDNKPGQYFIQIKEI